MTTAAAVITNGSANKAACGVSVSFNLVDAAGNVLATRTESVDWIPKSGSSIVVPLVLGNGITSEPTKLDVTTIVDAFTDTDDLKGCDSYSSQAGVKLLVKGASIVRNEGMDSVKGQVTNPSDQLVKTGYLDCVERQAGMIVGGESTAILDPIPPGGTVAFSTFSLEFIPDKADSVDCQVVA